MSEYHYDGNCSIVNFAMLLSGLSFSMFEIDELPDGYVEDDDFGPRVAEYDWFELMEKFPSLIALLAIAGLGSSIGVFWLCSSIKGLYICGKNKHAFCRCFVTFLLILILLLLVTGLYLSSRANHLLRKTQNEQKRYRDVGDQRLLNDSALEDFRTAEEFQNNTLQNHYENSLEELTEELNKLIASKLIEWQQIVAQNKQSNFKQLKYLYTNRVFYKNALKTLREIAYELTILGIEIDDFLRDYTRDEIKLLQSNESNLLHPVGRLNVWHLNALYFHYVYFDERLEYLMEAYTNITKVQESISKIKLNSVETENIDLKALNLPQFGNQFRSSSESQEKRSIQKVILYLALTMIFLIAALIYLLFMALGFEIFRYYEEANFLIKCFIFFSFLSILVVALLAALHFLLAMVLHTGICHENNHRSYNNARALSRSAEALDCSPYMNNNQIDFPTTEIRKNLLANIKHKIPHESISHTNSTADQSTDAVSLHEKWYEQDMQPLLATDDRYIAYVKQNYEAGTPQANLSLCKYNRIENMVKKELYINEFVPNATLLYKTITKINDRVRSESYNSFTKLLKGALSELHSFGQFYAIAKNIFLDSLDENFDIELRKFIHKFSTKSITCSTDHKNQVSLMRATNSDTKCGCMEDWLMICAIGDTLIVLSLFLSMILSMMLYKLNKRGPPICIAMCLPNGDNWAQTVATCAPTAPASDNACNEVQAPCASNKDYVVNIKGDISTRSANDCSPQTPLINTGNFISPIMGAVGYQPNSPQIGAGCNQNDGVISPLPSRSRTQAGCPSTSTDAQLVHGGTTNDKTVTVMVFQGPKDRQPLVTYPPPEKFR